MQTISMKAQQNTNQNNSHGSTTLLKRPALKSLGWSFFGLSKPDFRYSVRDTNAVYVKSYN